MRIFHHKLFWLLAIAVTARILFAVVSDYKTFPDSAWYFETGRQFLSGDYSEYSGKRAPLYPLLLAANGFDPGRAIFLQTAMGVVTTLLVFLIFRRLTGSATAGFLAGLVPALNPAQIDYEFTLGTEALCTLFIILSVYLLFRFTTGRRLPGWGELALVGAVSSLSTLTRPQYVIHPAFMALMLLVYLVWQRHSLRAILPRLGMFILPVLLLVVPWGLFQKAHIGQFVVSPDIGYAIMDHAVLFMEQAPAEYREITEVLIRHRDQHLRDKGEAYGCIEAARPELEQLTGLPYAELSRKLAVVAFATIAREPLTYLWNSTRAFIRFFKPFWPGQLWGVRPAVTDGGWLLRSVVTLYTLAYFAGLAVLFTLPILTLISRAWARAFPWRFEPVFLYALVLVTAGFQSFITLSENARFHATIEPLLLAFAAMVLLTAWRQGLLRPGKRQPV